MVYQDPFTNEKYIPTVVEHTIGCDRLMLVVLCDAYDEEVLENGETRVVMHFHPALAPYKIAVLPLQKNLSEKAREIYNKLAKNYMCSFDEAGSIGKRYRRQDEIGTPYCVTIDFDTLEKGTVTVRDRDSMKQDIVAVEDLDQYFFGKFSL